MDESLPLISVIVPMYNEEQNVDECILSLLNVDYPTKEIIIVDDGSSDRTAEVVAKHSVRLIRLGKNMGPSAARNEGIKAAKGDFIAFTDGDCIVDKFWLKKLIRNYTNPRVGGVGGPFRNPESGYFSNYINLAVLDFLSREKLLSTGNASFRAEILRRIGGFDSSFRTEEDDEISIRVKKAGYDLVIEPEAVVWHKSGFLDFIKWNFGGGINRIDIWFKLDEYLEIFKPLISVSILVLFCVSSGILRYVSLVFIFFLVLRVAQRVVPLAMKMARIYRSPSYVFAGSVLDLIEMALFQIGCICGLVRYIFSIFAMKLQHVGAKLEKSR